MSKTKPINEQVVVVFGASSGIGRAAALQFAAKGAKVVIATRGDEGLDTLSHEIKDKGGEVTAVVADVTHFDDVKRVADTAVARYGRIDSWAHLAAVSIYATFEDTTIEEYRQIMETNLMGTIHAAKAALPYLTESRGTFIPVTSVEALVALPYQSAYSASKHGVHGFLQALRLELAKTGSPVKVAEVQPVATDTPFFEKAKTKIGVQPQGMPPVDSPEKVAGVILHAAVHPSPEMPVGTAGKMLGFGARVAPRVTETFVELTGFAGQKTNKPKSADAPNNLYHPLPEYERVHGQQAGQVAASSIAPWVLAGLALGTVLVVASLAAKKGGNSGSRYPGYPDSGDGYAEAGYSSNTDAVYDAYGGAYPGGEDTRYSRTSVVYPKQASTINAQATVRDIPGPDGPATDPEYQGS